MTEVLKDSTSHSFFFELVDSTTGLPKENVLPADVTASYCRTRGERVAISILTGGSALASASAAYSSGGFILVSDTYQPGVVRLDVPNAVFATGVEEAVVTIKATGCRTVSRAFTLTGISMQVAKVPATIAAGDIATDAIDADSVKADAVTKIQAGISTYDGGDTPGTTELLTRVVNDGRGVKAELMGINGHDVAVDTGTAGVVSFVSGAYVMPQGGTVDANVTQINGENADSDSSGHLLVNILSGGEGFYDELKVTLGTWLDRIDENVSAAKTLTVAYDAAKTAASQTSVNDLPTNNELATALGTSDDAVLARLGTPTGVSIAADIAAIGGGGSAPTAEDVADEVESRSLIVGSWGAGVFEQLAALDRIAIFGSVVRRGVLKLAQGDDYSDDTERLIRFGNSAGSWFNLAGATVTLSIYDVDTLLVAVDGVVAVATGSGQRIDVAMTAAETTLVNVDKAGFRLVAVYPGGDVVTLEEGVVETLLAK